MESALESYILANYDRALTDGSIQPYYQPVIRTISGQLCSFEALARWVDAERGVIRPDQFIPVLEREKLIHRLDICIIRQVCERLRRSVLLHEIPIPVSVNLSRLDFALCDIFSVVDSMAAQYQIPHDFLYIEITESVMAEQEEEMRSIIDRFRTAGYQIWMDDFGSGYSSLNVLKDFVFDEIKLDMRFLSSFNQRSQRILTAVIQMAKEINIHTLAEGVETEEQFCFLRDIGCEKVQGYFFGRPMPYDQVMAHLRATGIAVEEPQFRRYYDDIGRVNLLSAVPFLSQMERDRITSARQLNSIPLVLVEVGREQFSVLFYNTAFEDTVSSTGGMAGIFSQKLLGVTQPMTILGENIVSLIDATRTNGEGKMYFINNEEYYELRGKCVARARSMCSLLFQVNNLSKAAESAKTSQLDEGLRQVYSLYERITLIDVAADTINPLYVNTRENMVSKRENIWELTREYAYRWILPEDQEDFLRFMNLSDVEKRMADSGRTHLATCLRTSVLHGQYQWKEYTLLRLQPGVYASMIRNIHDRATQFIQRIRQSLNRQEEVLSPEVLWKNLIQSELLRLFWKDRDRRFLGASQAFLDYYGFESLKEILGKTDEDLHWHVRPDHYMNDEILVIQEGMMTHNIPGRCIRNGENREILASKTPVRDSNGQIQGLMGYFIDRELLTVNDSRGKDTKRRDALTGLLNSRGLAEEARIYQDEYFLRNADFVCIQLEIEDFRIFIQQYGFDFCDKLMVELGKELKKIFGLSAAVGRNSGHQFAIYYQVKGAQEASNLRDRIRKAASAIQDIDGTPVTIYLSIGYALYSEFEDLTELTKHAEARLLADHGSSTSTENLMAKASELFHLYDDLPIPFAVFQVLTNEAGEAVDATIFYANRIYQANAGKLALEMLGRNTRSLFPNLDELFYRYIGRAAHQGEKVAGWFYFVPAKTDFYITVYQVIRPGFCACTFQSAVELDGKRQNKESMG